MIAIAQCPETGRAAFGLAFLGSFRVGRSRSSMLLAADRSPQAGCLKEMAGNQAVPVAMSVSPSRACESHLGFGRHVGV
jgi:hypothetical protein